MIASKLKRWAPVGMGLTCAVASIACAVAAWHASEPIKAFRADTELKDLGSLQQQEERDVVFRLINATEAPVEILQISTSCTCTRAEAVTRNLRPGESTDLTARLRIGSLRGRVAALVNVLYRVGDAQGLERLPLTITGTVEPHYTVTPEVIVFERGGDGQSDSIREASIIIAPTSEPVVRILKAYSTHPAFRVETSSLDRETGATTLRLVFDPSRCIAPSVKGEIVLDTDSKMEPIHRVPVRVVSKGKD
jgi:hypothetical protein